LWLAGFFIEMEKRVAIIQRMDEAPNLSETLNEFLSKYEVEFNGVQMNWKEAVRLFVEFHERGDISKVDAPYKYDPDNMLFDFN
jgi:hypothetical protein